MNDLRPDLRKVYGTVVTVGRLSSNEDNREATISRPTINLRSAPPHGTRRCGRSCFTPAPTYAARSRRARMTNEMDELRRHARLLEDRLENHDEVVRSAAQTGRAARRDCRCAGWSTLLPQLVQAVEQHSTPRTAGRRTGPPGQEAAAASSERPQEERVGERGVIAPANV
jgi:hypothetical protein